MRVTTFVETNEARVLSLGFKGNPEFDYGIEVDLPPAELVAFVKARDAWTAAQERLDMIYKAQLKRINGARRLIRKIGGRLRKLRQQRKAMPNPSTLLNGGNHGDVCESKHYGRGRPRSCLDGARNERRFFARKGNEKSAALVIVCSFRRKHFEKEKEQIRAEHFDKIAHLTSVIKAIKEAEAKGTNRSKSTTFFRH